MERLASVPPTFRKLESIIGMEILLVTNTPYLAQKSKSNICRWMQPYFKVVNQLNLNVILMHFDFHLVKKGICFV